MLPEFSFPEGSKSPQDSSDQQFPTLEVAHILSIDIVEYAESLTKIEQADRIRTLQEMVRSTSEFVKGEYAREMSCQVTDGGMALIFFREILGPIRCAAEIGFLLKKGSQFHVRMGVHSGPVHVSKRGDGRGNISGEGVVNAQRVMNCGDADHILLSGTVAEMISGSVPWSNCFHKLGSLPLKSGRLADLYNFYTREFGNPNRPLKFLQFEEEDERRARRMDWLRSIGGGFWNGTRAVALLAVFGLLGWFVVPKVQTYLSLHPFSFSFGKTEAAKETKSSSNKKRLAKRSAQSSRTPRRRTEQISTENESYRVNSDAFSTDSHDEAAPKPPVIEVEKQVDETDSGSNEKVHVYNMVLSIPEDNQKSRMVKVTCLDSRGLQPTILEASFSEGERVPIQFEGAGREVTLRAYFDDKFAKEWKITPADSNASSPRELH